MNLWRSPPGRPAAAPNKKSATGKRIAAVILWVLALAAEVGAILMEEDIAHMEAATAHGRHPLPRCPMTLI